MRTTGFFNEDGEDHAEGLSARLADESPEGRV